MPKPNSQPGFQPVHWFSKEEWKNAYLLMFGPESDHESKKKALELLFIWKTRNPYIPSGIESTLSLLEVDLQCPTDGSASVVPERLLRLMYSTALMRFINHSLDSAQSKKFTLLQAAKQMNIPEWIIDLRHETAHGHELPSLHVLQKAAHISLNWLHEAYWKPNFFLISDYLNNKVEDTFNENISELVNLHSSIVALQYPAFNISRFCDIPDKGIKNNLLANLKTVLKNDIKSKTSFGEVHLFLIEVIEKFMIKNMNMNHTDAFCEALINQESLFLTGNVVNSEKHKFVELNEKCLELWEPFLTILHTQNVLATLIKKLLNVINNDLFPVNQKEASAQWIKEIAFGLNKSSIVKKFSSNLNLVDDETVRQNLYNILIQNYPSQKKGLTFDLLQTVPLELTSLNFVQNVFMKSNPYLHIYANEIIELVEPKLPIYTRHKLINLVNIMSCNNYQHTSNENVYTVEDLKKTKQIDGISNENLFDNDMIDVLIKQNSIWQKSSDEHNWGSCPIGLLPWQDPKTFNLFPITQCHSM